LTKTDDLPSLSLSLHSHMIHHLHSFGLALFVPASHVTDAQDRLCDTVLLEESIDLLLNFRIDRHVGCFRAAPITGAQIVHSYIICCEAGGQRTSPIHCWPTAILITTRLSCFQPERELMIRYLRPLQTLCSGSQLARVTSPFRLTPVTY